MINLKKAMIFSIIFICCEIYAVEFCKRKAEIGNRIINIDKILPVNSIKKIVITAVSKIETRIKVTRKYDHGEFQTAMVAIDNKQGLIEYNLQIDKILKKKAGSNGNPDYYASDVLNADILEFLRNLKYRSLLNFHEIFIQFPLLKFDSNFS